MGTKKKAKDEVEARIELVRIRDIEKNPYRNFEYYDYLEYKLAELRESINETGYWETVIGRRKGKKIQLAFGHHRVKAAEQVFGLEAKIPIIVKPLSDDLMRKMMFRENKTEWGCVLAAIDEAVKVSRDHLMKDREHAKATLSRVRPDVKRVRIGAPAIAKDTGLSVTKVEESLRRLESIEKGGIDRAALYLMPNTEAARRFMKAVKAHPTSLPYQKTLAEHIVKRGAFGQASIDAPFIEFVAVGNPKDRGHPRYYEVKMIEATHLINKAATALAEFNQLNRMSFITCATKEDISGLVINNYNQALEGLGERVKEVGVLLDAEPLKPIGSDEEEKKS